MHFFDHLTLLSYNLIFCICIIFQKTSLQESSSDEYRYSEAQNNDGEYEDRYGKADYIARAYARGDLYLLHNVSVLVDILVNIAGGEAYVGKYLTAVIGGVLGGASKLD